jgi:hypothetical protein
VDHTEEVEAIPWGELLHESEERLDIRRVAYLAAGLIGAVVFGVVIARAWWSPTPPTIIAPADSVALGALPPAAGSGAVVTTAALPMYSEADLMADPPDPGERAAIARAEWFVTDYFTADYEPTGSADVRAALPGAADMPDLPQDGRGGISYVEWARAFRIEERGDGAYEVGIAFRALAAPPEGAFIRLPVRAVEVVVGSGPDGASVLDLPRPIPLPVGPEPAPWPEPGADPPQDVVDIAAARASVWGTEPRIVNAAATDDGWRVVLTVADDVGNRWPLALLVEI